MENALRACCNGIKIGKILVAGERARQQTDLVYEKLPHDIAERHVLLMDPILATGKTVCSAMEVLTKQRCVDEGKVYLLSLIAAPEGIHEVCKRYPRLKVITSEIDERLGPDKLVRPGIGDFGDRYFGTEDEGFVETVMHIPTDAEIKTDTLPALPRERGGSAWQDIRHQTSPNGGGYTATASNGSVGTGPNFDSPPR